MGFMDALTGGGAKSTTVQGYGALPKGAKKMIRDIDYGARQFVSPWSSQTNTVNQGNIDRFTPMGQTADETRAFDLIRQGFAPDQARLNSDMGMLQNPYNNFVMDEINRQAGGDYSILKQSLSEAGQLGSNRQNLGANDIDMARTNNIGSFLTSQYDKNLNYALNTLPALRMADATGMLGIGEQQRGLDMQTKQAPVSALQALAQLAQGAGFSSAVANSSKTTTSGGGGGLLSGLSTIGGALSGIGAIGGIGGGLMFGGSGLNGLGQGIGSLFSSSPYGPYQ